MGGTQDVEVLEAQEIEVIGLALSAAANGDFFPDWEFETLFGVTREEMRTIAAGWPGNWLNADMEATVFNTLSNLHGYPHGLDGELAGFGLTSGAMGAVLDKLQSNEPSGA